MVVNIKKCAANGILTAFEISTRKLSRKIYLAELSESFPKWMTSSFLTVSNEKTVFANSHCTTNYNDILNKIFKSNAIKLFK